MGNSHIVENHFVENHKVDHFVEATYGVKNLKTCRETPEVFGMKEQIKGDLRSVRWLKNRLRSGWLLG
jgi:hypothetical protein